MLKNILLAIVLPLVKAGECFVSYCQQEVNAGEYLLDIVMLFVNSGEYLVC